MLKIRRGKVKGQKRAKKIQGSDESSSTACLQFVFLLFLFFLFIFDLVLHYYL